MDYSESVMVGLKRASWFVLALAFVVSLFAMGDDDWGGIIVAAVIAAVAFGLARMAIWVFDGFTE